MHFIATISVNGYCTTYFNGYLSTDINYQFSVKRLILKQTIFWNKKIAINVACYQKGYQEKEKTKENYLIFQGNSSYTRPPPLTSGGYELYDSCVDNLSNPSMYIVFERDQCYPKYLIKYKLTKSLSHSSDGNANPSRPVPTSVESSSSASSESGPSNVKFCNAGTSYSSSLSQATHANQSPASQLASILPHKTSYNGSSATGNSRSSYSSSFTSAALTKQSSASQSTSILPHKISYNGSSATGNSGSSYSSSFTWAALTKQSSASQSTSTLPHKTSYNGSSATANGGSSYSSSFTWAALAKQYSTSQTDSTLPSTTSYHGSSATGNHPTFRSSQAIDKKTCIIQ